MADFAQNTYARPARPDGTLFTRLASTWATYLAYRKVRNELSQLSDRELDDIGIRPSDIERVSWEAAKGPIHG